jgi:hypothetical protein
MPAPRRATVALTSSPAALVCCLLAVAGCSERPEPEIERIGWFAGGEIVALLNSHGLALDPAGMQLYHDGRRVELFRLEPQSHGLYRLSYQQPGGQRADRHHDLVVSGGGLDPTRPIAAVLVEAQEDLRPAGLDTRGFPQPEISWIERHALALLAALALLSLYAAYRWLEERRRPPLRLCRHCGERIEAGFKVCVYCTFPGVAARSGKRASRGTASGVLLSAPVSPVDAATDPLFQDRALSAPPRSGGAAAHPAASRTAALERDEPDPGVLQETILLQRVPSLQIVEGSEPGRRFPLSTDEVFVGSSRYGDVVLPDPHVAHRHVRLVYKNAHYQVEDLSGGQGLRVNGRLLYRGKITFGDRMTVGGTTLLLLPD